MMEARPIELEKCAVCGLEYDKELMLARFTGRARYVCPECDRRGSKQVKASHREWRKTAKGKAVIEHCEKNK